MSDSLSQTWSSLYYLKKKGSQYEQKNNINKMIIKSQDYVNVVWQYDVRGTPKVVWERKKITRKPSYD